MLKQNDHCCAFGLDIYFGKSTTAGCIKCYFHDRICRFKADMSFVIQWASDLACQLLAIHNEEVARRRDFQSQFEGHFLSTLLPGMEDLPPPFATQAPSPFDLDLPKVGFNFFVVNFFFFLGGEDLLGLLNIDLSDV